MKSHYVYEIKYPNGMRYIGVRTCKGLPAMDISYTNSSKFIPKLQRLKGLKEILSVLDTREEALALEIALHAKFNVKDNPDFYNRANQLSTHFSMSRSSAEKSGNTRQGRTKYTHEYIAKQALAKSKYKGSMRTEAQRRADTNVDVIAKANIKRKQYTGINQTEAQRLGNIRMGKAQRGTKNLAKGKSGSCNNGFIPWYLLTPDNEYREFTSTTKADYAKVLGVTPRQLGNRFHHTNIGRRADLFDGRVPKNLRGFIFNNLING